MTGVDVSEAAIREAKKLSSDLGTEANFEVGEISSLAEHYGDAMEEVLNSLWQGHKKKRS